MQLCVGVMVLRLSELVGQGEVISVRNSTRRDFPLESIENDALFVEAVKDLLHSYRAMLSGVSEMEFEHAFGVSIELAEWLGDR